ncbi:hypothetical protein ACIF70_10165 [Actinacidiphila glaucinigra]|uniref:hypothetical protein n=1 Tax=Actinacidiphila glaucinigra TaxID=235986 RepID=UPI0037C6130E
MPELPVHHHATIDAIVTHTGRATLPFQRAQRAEHHATAFWFNELLETTDEGEVVRQFLVTADDPARRSDIAELTLRTDLGTPAPTADKLLMTGFAEGWSTLDGLGVAVMPTGGLHAYTERKGWSWTVDEITDGIAARAEDVAALGEEPVPAYLLGHDVGARGEREQAVVVGAVARAEDGVRWTGQLPAGCVGAPVFTAVPVEGDSFRLVCVGLALPGARGRHPVATFDRIRAALRTWAPDGDAPVPEQGKRRWWSRGRRPGR